LSSAGAQALGAQIAKLTAAETVGGQVLDPAAALATYVEVFQILGWGAVGLGVALGVASIWLRKLAHKGVVVPAKREADAKGVAAEA
jgi:POT family proton-dependent oligopeptide transporter